MDTTRMKALCREQQPYLCGMRKTLHCQPELSGREFLTIQIIARELDSLDIRHEIVPDGGILAWIGTEDAEAPCVLLRADCDALPIAEAECNGAGKRAYISQIPGCGHLCGHDAHTAMLLGAARVLKSLNPAELGGRICLLFERGEEGGMNYYYLMRHIQSRGIRIDSCFALHVEPKLPTGSVWLEEGPCHAGNVNFEIALHGTGGHGSRPDQANNPLDCFVAIMNDLNTFRMKHVAPQDILTVNVGSVHCGTKRNIVPETLEFKGTCRFYRSEAGAAFKQHLRNIIELNARLYDCCPDFLVFSGPSLSQCNHPGAAELARRAVAELLPEVTLVREKEPEMSSESYGVLCAYYPSVMGLLGTGNAQKGTCEGLHNPRFDVDTDALWYGTAAHVGYALKYLEEAPAFSFRSFPGDIDELMRFTDRIPPEPIDSRQSERM